MNLKRLLPVTLIVKNHLLFLLMLAVCISPLSALRCETPRSGSQRTASDAGYQIEAERHTMRLLERGDLQTELKTLEVKWKARWPQFSPSTLERAHDDLEELALLIALETVNGDARRPHVVQLSIPPHTWSGTKIPGGRWGIDNPDTQYFVVPLEASSSYVLTGKRGAQGPIDSNFSYSNLTGWKTLSNISQSQLQIDSDGRYVIMLDNTPPDGRVNHIQLKDDGNALIVRNTLADWNSEHMDRMEVRRVSGPPAETAPDDDASTRRIVKQLHEMLDHIISNLEASIFKLPDNFLPQPGTPGDKAGFLVTQRNALGHFKLQPDEALVVTLNRGGAAYTTLPLTDVWGVSPSYWDHQSSLNNRQAVANADGTITAVISAWDPGVANWVDTAGLEEGIIMLRWQGLSQEAAEASRAGVTSVVVKRPNLQASLPPGTQRVSPSERRDQLTRRKQGFESRFSTATN